MNEKNTLQSIITSNESGIKNLNIIENVYRKLEELNNLIKK